jgi:antibiotic biosynthesis monooxygenase (ABM) superfamily enzyme
VRTKIAMNLLAWVSAFLIILALFALFGDQLQARSLPVRALIISGVMVILMLNVVIPALRRLVSRWQKASPPSVSHPNR